MEPNSSQQPPATPSAAESMLPPEQPASSSPLSWLSIIGFVILAGTVIGIFLWWVWIKSPLVIWLKIVLTVIPFAIFAAVI
jgi:hypothetical protein